MEDNRLIAEFMGLKPKMESPDVYTYSDFPWISIREDNPEKVMRGIINYAKYNYSWDWLMPVVEKINSFRNEDNQKLYTIETSFNGGATLRVRFYENEDDPTAYYTDTNTLKAIYRATVDFIKWYNQNKL
jgi:hypothetical protein